jgi:hypothetical protein
LAVLWVWSLSSCYWANGEIELRGWSWELGIGLTV